MPCYAVNHAAADDLRGIPSRGTEACRATAALGHQDAWEMVAAHSHTSVPVKSDGARQSFLQAAGDLREAVVATKRWEEVRCAEAAVRRSSDAVAIHDDPSRRTKKGLGAEAPDKLVMGAAVVAMLSYVVGAEAEPVQDAAVEARQGACPVRGDGSKAAGATGGCSGANHGNQPQVVAAEEDFAEMASSPEAEHEAARFGGLARVQVSLAYPCAAVVSAQAYGTCGTGTFSARQTSVPLNQLLHSDRL